MPFLDARAIVKSYVVGSTMLTVLRDLDLQVEHAFRAYADDVRAGRFPASEHLYPIDSAHEAEIRAARVSAPAPSWNGGSAVQPVSA